MDVLETYKIQVSFDTVRFIIEQKQFPINENGKANIQRSIVFLQNVMQSIDSLNLSKNDEEKVYYFTPKLREIIGIKCNKPKISKTELDDSKRYFNEVKSKLEIMMVDPRQVYASPQDADKLKKIISQIMDVYTEAPYIVENDFSFSDTMSL